MQKKALLLEDDDLYREVLSEVLIDAGFDVSAFADPLQYLHCTSSPKKNTFQKKHDFDVILTDYDMPGMTGLAFLETLANEHNCPLPCHRKAVISGGWSEHWQTSARQHGYKTFHKPTELNQILAWLQEAVTY